MESSSVQESASCEVVPLASTSCDAIPIRQRAACTDSSLMLSIKRMKLFFPLSCNCDVKMNPADRCISFYFSFYILLFCHI